jgi:PAS domain-containing protein
MHASNEEEHIGTEQQPLPDLCPANESFNQCLIQCVPNVILFLSPDHLILEFNPEAERLYGRKREDVLGKDYFEEFLPDDAREAVAADIEKVTDVNYKFPPVRIIVAYQRYLHSYFMWA